MLARYSNNYQEIADSLAPVLPENWSEARVLAEMRADNAMVVGFARVDGNSERVWLDLPRPVSAATVSLNNTVVAHLRPAADGKPSPCG